MYFNSLVRLTENPQNALNPERIELSTTVISYYNT